MDRPEYEDDLEHGWNYFGVLRIPETATEFEVVAAVRERLREAGAFGKVNPDEVALLERARRTLTGPERAAYQIALSRTVFKPYVTFGEKREGEDLSPSPLEDSPRFRAAIERLDAQTRAMTIELHTNSEHVDVPQESGAPDEAAIAVRALIDEAGERAGEPAVAAWLQREKELAAAAKLPLGTWLSSWWRLERMWEVEAQSLEGPARDLIARTRATLAEMLGRTGLPLRSEGAVPPRPRDENVRPLTPKAAK